MRIDDQSFQFLIQGNRFHCALDVTMWYIGGKWKTVVLWYLRNNKKRFSELKLLIPDITDKMLSTQLKALEEEGLVNRELFAAVPPKVEYSLTEEGRSLIPVLDAIATWGRQKAEKEGKLVKYEP